MNRDSAHRASTLASGAMMEICPKYSAMRGTVNSMADSDVHTLAAARV